MTITGRDSVPPLKFHRFLAELKYGYKTNRPMNVALSSNARLHWKNDMHVLELVPRRSSSVNGLPGTIEREVTGSFMSLSDLTIQHKGASAEVTLP